jgi:hypothetical protein
MEPVQRKLYNELLAHYRATLLGMLSLSPTTLLTDGVSTSAEEACDGEFRHGG